MRTPTEFELQRLLHQQQVPPASSRAPTIPAPKAPNASQRHELATRITSLSKKLIKLEAKIREMETTAPSENRKVKAKKERSAKEKDNPKTAVEKAKARKELTHNAKEASNQSGDDKKAASISELKALATKVKGQIAIAKQKLAAL